MILEKKIPEGLKILLIEDDEAFRMAVVHLLGVYNEVVAVGTLSQARSELSQKIFDVILTDKQLPDGLSTDCIAEFKAAQPKSVLIVLTGDLEYTSVKKCLLDGADDYVFKSENIVPDLLIRIPMTMARASQARKLDILSSQMRKAFRYEIVGKSPTTLELREQILSLRGSSSHVLITGESGTGKELIARRIHAIEDNFQRPFVAINCSAIPENLFEAELFGYRRGAFTGANQDQVGKFEIADGGDLFLDEVGEIPLALQSKLLRAIQDGEFYKLGATRPTRVNCRIIAATNQELEERVSQKQFREDLYYRLNVVRLETTPLRFRADDVSDLARYFILQLGGPAFEFKSNAVEALRSHSWPGNIRELRNTIERAILSSKRRKSAQIELGDIHLDRGHNFSDSTKLAESTGELNGHFPKRLEDLNPENFQNFFEELERRYFSESLKLLGGDVSQLAQKIGLGRSTLFKKISTLNLSKRTLSSHSELVQ